MSKRKRGKRRTKRSGRRLKNRRPPAPDWGPDELPEPIVSELGRFKLIHLDNPDPETVSRRIADFDPADHFEDDCPICVQMREQGGDIFFGESGFTWVACKLPAGAELPGDPNDWEIFEPAEKLH